MEGLVLRPLLKNKMNYKNYFKVPLYKNMELQQSQGMLQKNSVREKIVEGMSFGEPPLTSPLLR